MDTISCRLLLHPLRHRGANVAHDGIQRLGRVNGADTRVLRRQFQIARASPVKEIKRFLLNAIQIAARSGAFSPTSGVTSRYSVRSGRKSPSTASRSVASMV